MKISEFRGAFINLYAMADFVALGKTLLLLDETTVIFVKFLKQTLLKM